MHPLKSRNVPSFGTPALVAKIMRETCVKHVHVDLQSYSKNINLF